MSKIEVSVRSNTSSCICCISKEVVIAFVDRSILRQNKKKTVKLSRNLKNVLHSTMTHFFCCNKDESRPLFHQSVTQLISVKFGFDEIQTMSYYSSKFRCSSLFLQVLFVAIQALARPGNSANSTPVSSTATKDCSNVYNSFYAGPNKEIETILQEMKKQLTQLQDDINILKGNKTTVKGKICFIVWS